MNFALHRRSATRSGTTTKDEHRQAWSQVRAPRAALPQAQPSAELVALQRLIMRRAEPDNQAGADELDSGQVHEATKLGTSGAMADLVQQGRSAEVLLDQHAGQTAASVQRDPADDNGLPVQATPAGDAKAAEKPAVDKKAEFVLRLEAASQNEQLTPEEAYQLLAEYNKQYGKDRTVEGVADFSGYHGEKGKLVQYPGRGGIDVDGRSAVGRQGFRKAAAPVRAELEAQEKAAAEAEKRKPKAVTSEAVDAATKASLEAEGRYYDPASQPDIAGYKLKDAQGKATVVPDAAKLPYSSVPVADPILNLVPYGAVVFVKYGNKISLTIRIDAGGEHVGEISRAAGEQVGVENLDPIHGGVSSKSLDYLAVPSVRIPNGTLSVDDESPEGLTAAAMPKVRAFLHTLATELGGGAKK